MEIMVIVKSLLALSFCAVLLYGILKLLQKYGKFGYNGPTNSLHKVTIDSIAYIDQHNKIINFNCNDKNYLLLLGKNNELLIDKYENDQPQTETTTSLRPFRY